MGRLSSSKRPNVIRCHQYKVRVNLPLLSLSILMNQIWGLKSGRKLNSESWTVTPSAPGWSSFALEIDFLGVEVKPFRLYETERANNHVKQGNTFFFARHPIGVTTINSPQCWQIRFIGLLEGQGLCHIKLSYWCTGEVYDWLYRIIKPLNYRIILF